MVSFDKINFLPLQQDLVTDISNDIGMRNIFDVKTELRSRRLLINSFAYFVYAMRRTSQKKYPDVSVTVLKNERYLIIFLILILIFYSFIIKTN